MNSDHSFSFPNSMDYPDRALTNNETNSEEHHPQPFSNTNLPMFNLGVGNGMSNVGDSGGSIVGRLSRPRPRGRPRGSKNKSKEDVLQMTSLMKSIVLEIPPGSEVIEWLRQFAQSRNIFMNVIGGSGIFSQAVISHMPSEHPKILSENLCLVSFRGTVGKISPLEPFGSCSFSASLGRLNGSVVGGTLWRLVSLAPVVVNALISKSPEVIGAGYKALA
ncbi:hypothetical protein POM88_042795 [Heracleum sosnowskyi]|uniref:PPC domain-containing protein n=1 Tax=Heracleum sosnowskyi TaxID=360622 RepID=A0AAD8MBY5_9APIA|nr:hypothetical protein POM88_042795 [Heracleum sosnowskyi]